MASAPPASARETADARMTAEREETKYLVAPAHWERLAAELSRRMPGHRFTGDGANRLPDIGRGIGKGIRNFKDATKEGAAKSDS